MTICVCVAIWFKNVERFNKKNYIVFQAYKQKTVTTAIDCQNGNIYIYPLGTLNTSYPLYHWTIISHWRNVCHSITFSAKLLFIDDKHTSMAD